MIYVVMYRDRTRDICDSGNTEHRTQVHDNVTSGVVSQHGVTMSRCLWYTSHITAISIVTRRGYLSIGIGNPSFCYRHRVKIILSGPISKCSSKTGNIDASGGNSQNSEIDDDTAIFPFENSSVIFVDINDSDVNITWLDFSVRNLWYVQGASVWLQQ